MAGREHIQAAMAGVRNVECSWREHGRSDEQDLTTDPDGVSC